MLSIEDRIAGILAPVFALRGRRDLGVGDTAAVREFVDWCAAHGFRLLQVLPINETGGDHSPYNAISSIAIEPTTIETTPEAIPDLRAEDYEDILCSVDLKRLQTGPVNYAVVKPLKRRMLEAAFETFNRSHLHRRTKRAREFSRFYATHWVADYVLFRVLMDENGGSEQWDRWPEEQRTARSARAWLQALGSRRRQSIEKAMRFFAYVQWIAFAQWHALHQHARERGVALMGDIPLGVSYYSADIFAQRDLFDLTWSCGAPPEPYFKDDLFTRKWGQNWGFPLYRWDVMRENGWQWWRQRVHGVREFFDLFRIDHVLGFYRIYCFPWRPEQNAEFLPLSHDEARARTGGRLPHFIPRDDSHHENCEANRRSGEELLRMIVEEAGAGRVVGEDLGTVPYYVRPSLTSLGIPGYKIPMWESAGHGRLLPGDKYQRLSVATYGTHDHEPLRALWKRWLTAIAAQRSGQPDSAGPAGEAWHGIRSLLEFTGVHLHGEPPAFTDELHERLLRTLFASNSWIAICMVTDLFGRTERFNVPGAISSSNWSQRMHLPVSRLDADADAGRKLERIRRALHETGRA